MKVDTTNVRRFISRLAPALLPVIVIALMLGLNPVLRKPATWEQASRNWAGVALLACALTPIIVTGGIDLSVGSVVGVAAVSAGFLWRSAGLPLELALAAGVGAGLLCGLTNGALILTGINPLVVTLATLAVFRGVAYALSGAERVRFPPSVLGGWQGNFLGVPNPLWLILISFAIGHVFLHHTWMGRMLFALGDNVRAARYAGVPVRTLTLVIYAGSGLMAGIVGLTTVLQSAAAPANTGQDMELKAIAGVVLGGTRITGGSGTMAGTLLGTLTLAALLEGMVYVAGEWRLLTTGGLLIVVAIANEALARRLQRT
jgi:rhamnose transport system permease protein